MTPLEILEKIQHHSEAYYVGGYVRDMLLKKESEDIDIATRMTYGELKRLFSDCKMDEVGKRFQVLMIDGIEVATYRTDHYDINGNITGTRPTISLETDLDRRDLTINSIAYDPINDKLIDTCNAQEDIKKRIIRFNGISYIRIIEDPIRMLRACRFLATINRSRFALDTFKAIRANANLLKDIPKERIRLEIIKAMKAKNAGNFFRALHNTNLLQYVFPSMLETVGVDGGRYHNETVFEHCLMACDNIKTDNPLLKIAAFLHDVGKPMANLLNSNGSFKGHDKIGSEMASENLKDLKFSNDEIHYITSIIELHMNNLTLETTPKSIRKMRVKLENKNIDFDDFTHMVIADHDANMKHEPHEPDMWFKLTQLFLDSSTIESAFSVKDLAIGGNEVMTVLTMRSGPNVGRILNKLFDMVVENPELNKRETLLGILIDRNFEEK